MKKILLILLVMISLLPRLSGQTRETSGIFSMKNPAFVPTGVSLHQPVTGIHTILSGYLNESFENTTFPPASWQIQNIAGASYTWARATTQAHSGAASAFMRYDAAGGEDWLITPRFSVGATTDSLIFWMRLAFAGYAPDSLCIRVSVTDSLPGSFTSTLLKLSEGTNYPPNATSWNRYAISLSSFTGQNIYLAFAHYNADGDGLYIDDVEIGTLPANEVSTFSINTASMLNMGVTILPRAIFRNNGSATQTFDVTTQINPGGYSSTMSISNLPPSSFDTIDFAGFTPLTTGTYTFKTFTRLPGDSDHSNDTLIKTVTVLDSFPNNGWSARSSLPATRWATAPAFTKNCIASTDTGYIYIIGGGDGSFANSSLNSRFNTDASVWAEKSVIPTSRTQFTPVTVQRKIFAIGGYSGSFSPVSTVSIYNPDSNTWTDGTGIPTAVGDYAIGTYGDSLIYVVCGYNGSTDVNTVQIYNVNTNTWTTGTPMPGTASAGCRMGITGNKIVLVGGYSQTLGQSLDNAYLGVIDPMDPQVITWNALPDYPGGTVGRHAAGVSFENDGRVYFCGGDPNGQGTAVINKVFAYNTVTSNWETGPDMITGVSNISGLTGIISNNNRYLVTTGGYNGSVVVSSHEWLDLGPATPLPQAPQDTAICMGSTFTLNATGATTYNWSPSTGLSDTTIANPMVTAQVTTAYTVTMGKAWGCPVLDTITVTVNSNPELTVISSDALCHGNADGTAVATVSGNSTYWYSWSNGGVTDSVNLIAGTYSVTVTDSATGCFASDTVVISEPAALNLAITSDTAQDCQGMLIATVTGGIPPYTFEWNDPATQTGDTADNLCPGIYSLLVTDSNGCTISGNGEVVTSSSIETSGENLIRLYPNPFSAMLNLSFSKEDDDPMTILLSDLPGRQIAILDNIEQRGTFERHYDLSELPAGCYFIKIVSGSGIVIVKSIIKD